MKKYCKEEILLIDNIPGIYLIQNRINGKCYIGQSIYLRKRLLKHLTLADRKMYDAPLYRAIEKYGIDSFDFDVLETLNTTDYKTAKTQLDIWEKEYIIKYNSYGNTGYNQTIGGDAGIIGYKFTEEQKQHQREIRKKEEANKINMIYLYLIHGSDDLKYITAGNLTHLNNALKYHGLKEIDPLYFRNAKRYITIYDSYILAMSKEELENKISIFYSDEKKNKFKKLDLSILDEYKKVVDLLPNKTVLDIMRVTGFDKHTVYNRNKQAYGMRVIQRIRK